MREKAPPFPWSHWWAFMLGLAMGALDMWAYLRH